jgi:NTE family protein
MPTTRVVPADIERALSPIVDDPSKASVSEEEIGLCLSGGGYRAMLFHAGVLWRLNELGWLAKLDRIASVSGGSITAGVLALKWSELRFGDAGVASNFVDGVVAPLREMARTSIDVSSVIAGLLPGTAAADQVTRHYRKKLFGDATLRDLPDRPRFTFCATNVQSASLFRFAKKRAADWRVGTLDAPAISLARVVTASSAFPPMLSPCEIRLDTPLQPFEGAELNRPPFTTQLVLSDGGVYDNLGLEPIWKNCGTVLVSDAGQKIRPEEAPAEDWPRHVLRVLDLIDNQVRSLRKRQVVGSYVAGLRKGAYWGIRTDIDDYQLASAMKCPHALTERIAATPTRLTALNEESQQKLINWGYAVCDAAMRRHVATEALPPGGFPYAIGVG